MGAAEPECKRFATFATCPDRKFAGLERKRETERRWDEERELPEEMTKGVSRRNSVRIT